MGILLGALLVAWPVTDARAIQVAPTIVFVPSGVKSGELLLRNGTDGAVEVSVEILFGYEISDDQGKGKPYYPADDHLRDRSAASWIRAYPKKVRLKPKQEQTVRFLIRRPRDLAAGEYWARAAVKAVPILPPLKLSGEQSKPQFQLGVSTDQRVPIFVRHGDVSASAKILEVKPKITSDSSGRSVELLYKVATEGGGAFLGQTQAQLLGGQGQVLAEATRNLAVFEPGLRSITVVVLADKIGPEKKLRARLLTMTSHPAVESKYLLPGSNDKWEQDLVFP